MSAVVETLFFRPKISDYLILNCGGRLTRTEQLIDCGLSRVLTMPILLQIIVLI